MLSTRGLSLICAVALVGAMGWGQVLPQREMLRRADSVAANDRDAVPLKSWQAPLYYKSTPMVQSAEEPAAKPTPKPEALNTGSLSNNALSFVALPPCRVVDTRSATVPSFGMGFGPPSVSANSPRNIPLTDGACGIPTNPPPQAYSLNVTVVPVTGASHFGGFITIYPGVDGPQAGPLPLYTSLVWQASTVYISNAVTVASNPTDGSIYVDSNVLTDVVIDINGYYVVPNVVVSTDTPTGTNTSIGFQAFQANTVGTGNTASGYQALEANSVGIGNTASGAQSLQANTKGTNNTAAGFQSLEANLTGSGNTGFGFQALGNNTMGVNNTAVGAGALFATTGNYNTAFGVSAGANVTTGSNNILIGNSGTSADGVASSVIRIGELQVQTYVAGIRNSTTGLGDAVPVVIDSMGQLGTVNSSRRFKEDIQDMAGASDGLLRLRPVTYRYKQPYADGSQPVDYGLIAEEVAAVYPDLVVRAADGQAQTVQYQKLTPMLLNELQKQSEVIRFQEGQLEKLANRLAALEGAALASGADKEPAAH